MALPNWASGASEWAKTHKPQAFFLAAALVVVVALFLFTGESPQEVREREAEETFEAGSLPEDAPTAKAMALLQEIVTSLELTLGEERERRESLERDLARQESVFTSRLAAQDRSYAEELEAALQEAIAMAREHERQAIAAVAPPAALPRLRVLGRGVAGADPASPVTPPPPAPVQPESGDWVRLPSGSLVTGELITGAFATRTRGDALPVLMKLRSAYSGPNETEVPLEGCLLIGKATADLQSVRARVEAVSLSCVLPDGAAFERQVRGYLTGEDGTLGVPGRWEFRTGRWLANLFSSLGTATAGVFGDVFVARELGATGGLVLGDIGTSDAVQRIQQFFLERAEEIVPVVWIESGTPVYLVMLEGLTIEGLPADGASWASVAADLN